LTATREWTDNRPVRRGASALGCVLAVLLAATPGTVTAQVSPTAAPHPTMPWGGVTTSYGQFIRFVYMPPQPVTLEYLVAGAPAAPPPAAEPPAPAEGEAKGEDTPPADAVPTPAPPPPPAPQIVRQQLMLPGYYVRETTVGFHYPERWVVEQTALNAYRWRMLPSQFVPK
jgi:hypothetical protein